MLSLEALSSSSAMTPCSLPAPATPSPTSRLPQLAHRRVAFTTPTTYSDRLTRLLLQQSTIPIPIPTIQVSPTPSTLRSLLPSLPSFSAVALPSRAAISSLSLALPLPPNPPPLPPSTPTFSLSALGSDAQLVLDLDLPQRLCTDPSRVHLLVPEVASPAGMVSALGEGEGRRILCLVPSVVDLEEPPVVPDFLRDLEDRGWVAVRASAYETRWAGPSCVEGLVDMEGDLDALVFTSTAEVEGFLRGLESVGWGWNMIGERWPAMVVAAHGPVTAAGVERHGVAVDVVGERFGSFRGVLEALAERWSSDLVP